MKLIASRHISLLLVAIFVLAIVVATAVNAANPDTGRAGGTDRPFSSELAGGWHFVRPPTRMAALTQSPSCILPTRRVPTSTLPAS